MGTDARREVPYEERSGYFKIIFETGAGKYVALARPSGFSSSESDATEFMNLIDFHEQTEHDDRYKVGSFETRAAPELT